MSQSTRKAGVSPWKGIALCMIIVIVPWALYANFHPRFENIATIHSSDGKKSVASTLSGSPATTSAADALTAGAKFAPNPLVTPGSNGILAVSHAPSHTATTEIKPMSSPSLPVKKIEAPELPVLGPIPTSGSVPLFGNKHKGTDAIFALACKYPKVYYQRFVGSLRKFGYNEDIVLAVSPPKEMKRGVEKYIKEMNVVAYEFDVDCKGKDSCQLKDSFLGYPDPRPHRTFANVRYALYEYWLQHYNDNSYIFILDFRDTFFQANPFQFAGSYEARTAQQLTAKAPIYDLKLFEENTDVKNIGICVFNSNWIKTCFGKPALEALRKEAVICSGSTLGSFPAVKHYVRTMLHSMDTVKCWLKGVSSDQGYHNYLYYFGHFNTALGNATAYKQGHGIVNTLGAMNGFRVPPEKRGPLDTHWKARDAEGYVVNYDGTRSPCVHQWDRWHKEMIAYVDSPAVYDS